MRAEEDFAKACQEVAQQQQTWVETAESLTAQYKEEWARNIKLVTQAKQMGLLDVHGMPVQSQLTEDLRREGISCIEKVPQIKQVREAQGIFASVSTVLGQNHLETNIRGLLTSSEERRHQ